MFKVLEHDIGRFGAIRLLNKSTGEYAEILTDFGAGLNDLVIKNADEILISVIDGYRTEAEVINEHHSIFKGSKLSPFPNRVFGGNYEFEGATFQLPINDVVDNNHLHAFLHNRPFKVIETNEFEDFAQLVLAYQNLGVDQGYPFTYDLKMNIQYYGDGLILETEITNTDDKLIPIGDGWHPYFSFDSIDQIQLQMESAKRVYSGNGNGLSASHGFESLHQIGGKSFDDCFEIEGNSFALKLKDDQAGITLRLTQESAQNQYKYLQLYTPPTRKSIAVEPVTCAPNAFNTGQGLIVLPPAETIKMKFEIESKTHNSKL